MSDKNLSRPPAAVDAQRRIDLDWVRIAAFGLLIFYHVGMLYVSWDFHVKSEHRITALEPVMIALNPWRLALLFVVSGAVTRFMLGKYTVGRFMAARTWRLLVPLLFGMLVVVPPQAYDQVVESVRYGGSFLHFYLSDYFAFGPRFCNPGPCILLPTWNHLWFVAYLFVYTLVLGAVLAAWPGLHERIGSDAFPKLSGAVVLLAPALLCAMWRLWLLPRFPSTHALAGDWYNHALFGTMFLSGFAVARAEGVWTEIERLRWWALGCAVPLYALVLTLRFAGQPLPAPLGIAAGLAYGFYQWFAIVAVLGFAGRWLNRDSPARRYLTDAIFPYYIVHQTAIIAIAHHLKGWQLPAWVEAGLVISGTAAACAATYEIVRRIAPLRPLFGLRRNAA
ncbi:MAG: acyltransferase family protein [Tardiphaga sp.]